MKRLIIVINTASLDLAADIELAISNADSQISLSVGGGTITSSEDMIAHLESNIPAANLTVNGSIVLISGGVKSNQSHVLIGTVGGEVSANVATFVSRDTSVNISDAAAVRILQNEFSNSIEDAVLIASSAQ